MELFTITGLLATCLTALTVLYLLRSFFWRKRVFSFFKNLSIPGPKPHLITGNGQTIRNGPKLPLHVMDEWQEQFGDVYGYFIGPKPYLVVGDLDLVQQVLVKDFHNFVNRPEMGIEIKPVINTLVGLRGQRWKEVRSILSPTFSMSKLKKISSIINQTVDILVEVVKEKAVNEDGMDFYGLFQGLTCQVIGECALATQVDSIRDPEDVFLNNIRNFLLKAKNPIIDLAIYFPLVRDILALLCNVASPCGQFTNSIIENVQNVIDSRRRNPGRYADVLQLLLDAAENKNSTSSDSENNNCSSKPLPEIGEAHKTKMMKLLSDNEIVANSWVFLLGGFETTANALTYCAYLLAKHPEVQEKLYQEIKECCQDVSELSDYNKIKKLPYLDQVFCETLRIYPPVVMFITREACEDIQVGPYFVPAKTNIQIPIWQIHHNPNYWDDPYTFNPDRFDPDLRKLQHPMSWIPFGAGPRNCIGMRFALLEAKIALAKILINYKLVPCARTEENLKISVPTVTLNPQNGVWLKAEIRKN